MNREPSAPGIALLKHVVNDAARTRRMAALIIVGTLAVTAVGGLVVLLVHFAGVPSTATAGVIGLLAGFAKRRRR
jgi:hypothetical protein